MVKSMSNRRIQIGDKVRVIGIPKMTFARDVKDELGSAKLFKSMLGNAYTVRGFDRYGNIELQPRRSDTVWIEPHFIKLQSKKVRIHS
jgi:hypothetical protein